MAGDLIRAAVRARCGENPGVAAEGLDEAGREGLMRLIDRRACRDYAARAVPEGLVAATTLAWLGSCPTSVIRNRAEAVSAALGLPDRVCAVARLCMGYGAATAGVSPRRGSMAGARTSGGNTPCRRAPISAPS